MIEKLNRSSRLVNFLVSAVLFEPFPVTDKIFFLRFKSLLVLHYLLLDFCLQKSLISTSYYARSFVGYTRICLRFPYLDKYSPINYYLNKQTKLNITISLKVIPQYCTGHPVLRIKIT